MDNNAEWYFTHESEEDRLWYQIFFAMCRKFGISWSKATLEQKAFVEELTRVNFEREQSRRGSGVPPVRGFFDEAVSA